MNQPSSQARSASLSSSVPQTMMPASRIWPRSARQVACCASISTSARSWMAASCCVGVRPSGERLVMPAPSWPISPATRTE
jgi:hypothetical protein